LVSRFNDGAIGLLSPGVRGEQLCERGKTVGFSRTGGLVLAALGLPVLFGSEASAVDLENRDRKAHEVTINRADGSSETLTVKPGQRIEDICNDCVVLVGESSVETRGRATVKIEGGEVSIASQR
jgi:hypothetical protein